MDAVVEQRLLDGDQNVVGQHAKKDVTVYAMLEMMEYRQLGER